MYFKLGFAVQESIALLLTCKQFAVDGSAEAIRKMLPLILSREQGMGAPLSHSGDQTVAL